MTQRLVRHPPRTPVVRVPPGMLEPDRVAMFRALRAELSDSDPSKPVVVPMKWNVVELAPKPAKKRQKECKGLHPSKTKRAKPRPGWWFR